MINTFWMWVESNRLSFLWRLQCAVVNKLISEWAPGRRRCACSSVSSPWSRDLCVFLKLIFLLYYISNSIKKNPFHWRLSSIWMCGLFSLKANQLTWNFWMISLVGLCSHSSTLISGCCSRSEALGVLVCLFTLECLGSSSSSKLLNSGILRTQTHISQSQVIFAYKQ